MAYTGYNYVKFPKDNAKALNAFFGDPSKSEPDTQLVPVNTPFTLWYGKKKVTTISFHKKASQALLDAMELIWDYYGHDQKLIDKLEISNYSGAFAHRMVRGSTTKWSNHAYGAAYDMDYEGNELGKTHGTIPMPVVAAFKACGFSWGGDYKNRKDWMHFEACDRGDGKKTFEQWLTFYKCPPVGSPKAVVKAAPSQTFVREVPAVAVERSDTPTTTAKPAQDVTTPRPVQSITPKPSPAPAPQTVARQDDRFDMGDDEQTAEAVEAAKPAPVATSIIVEGQYSIEVEIVQTALRKLGYTSVGEADGKLGGATKGAITAFKNDRHLGGPVVIDAVLKAELEKAYAEGFKRPIAEARASATTAQLVEKLPEVKAADNAQKAGFWSSVTLGGGALVTGLMNAAGEAVGMLAPLKEFVTNVPWYVWVGLALATAGAIYITSREAGKAKDAATDAYKEGART